MDLKEVGVHKPNNLKEDGDHKDNSKEAMDLVLSKVGMPSKVHNIKEDIHHNKEVMGHREVIHHSKEVMGHKEVIHHSKEVMGHKEVIHHNKEDMDQVDGVLKLHPNHKELLLKNPQSQNYQYCLLLQLQFKLLNLISLKM